jgi:heterodisulfide reductase subunit A-like polyferredoxin
MNYVPTPLRQISNNSSFKSWMCLDTMEKCDVLVVGAGMAGLSAAARLSEAGINVVLIGERKVLKKKYLKRINGFVYVGDSFVPEDKLLIKFNPVRFGEKL